MKRYISLLLALFLCLGAASCSAPAAAPDWEEQYELGMRFLSDGDWEQAIPAFLAAIEIDPKRADAYLALADAYVAAGEPEKAKELLASVPPDIDNPDAVKEKLDGLSGAEESTSSTLESTPPSADGAPAFEDRDGYTAFDELPAENQALTEELLDAALSDGDLTEIFDSLDWDGSSFSTEYSGYKIKVNVAEVVISGEDAFGAPALAGLEQHIRSLSVELRPEEGSGFFLRLQTTEGPVNPHFDGDPNEKIIGSDLGVQTISAFGSCPCSGWQWNGTMTLSRTISLDSAEEYLRGEIIVTPERWTQTQVQTETGLMKDSLRTGVFTTQAQTEDNLYGPDTHSWENSYAEGTDFVSLSNSRYANAADAAAEEIW